MSKIQKIDKKQPPIEYFLDLLKASVSSSPIAGSFASLALDYIPKTKEKRLYAFLDQVAEKMAEIEYKINVDSIQTEEYAFLFEQSIKGVLENYQKEKIEAFKNFMVNSLIIEDVRQELKEFFLHLVKTLPITHFRVFTFLRDPSKHFEQMEISEEGITGSFGKVLKAAFPDTEFKLVEIAIEELYEYGLVTSGKVNIGAVTVTQGMGHVQNKITALGDQFASFIMEL